MKWIVFALMLVAGTGWGATLSLVPTGQPGDYTVFDTAYAAMLATDTLQVGITVTGPVTLTKGTFTNHPVYPGGFTSTSTDINTGTICVQSGAVSIIGLYINNLTTTLGRCLRISGANVTAHFERNTLVYTGKQQFAPVLYSGTSGMVGTFLNNSVYSDSVTAVGAALVVNAGASSVSFISNLVYGSPSKSLGTGMSCSGTDYNSVFLYNTIYGFDSGLGALCRTTAKNNVIANCSTCVAILGTGSYLDYINSAAEGSVVNYGPGCVSITAANTFVNPNPSQLQDFIPLHNSLIARAGIPISGVTTDILGNPYMNPPSMGAIQAPASGWDWLDRYYWNSEAIR